MLLQIITAISDFLWGTPMTVALVGVGCKISLRDLFTKGYKPVLLGGCTWLAVAVVTLSYVIFLM